MIVPGLISEIDCMDQQLDYRLLIRFETHPLLTPLALSGIKDIVLLKIQPQEGGTQDLTPPEDSHPLLLPQESEIGIPRMGALLTVPIIHMFDLTPLVVVVVIEVSGVVEEECRHKATPEKITLDRDGAAVKTWQPLLRRDQLQKGWIFVRSL